LPNKKLQQIYSDIYQEAKAEAEEIIGDAPAEIDEDTIAWKEWSDTLVQQLEDSIVKSSFPMATSYNYDYLNDYEWNYGKKKKKKKKKAKQEKLFEEN
jgi:hypothetical protein